MSDGRRVGIFGRIKSNLIKWWQFTILPVLRINNDASKWSERFKTNNQEEPVKEDTDGRVQQTTENQNPQENIGTEEGPVSKEQAAGSDPLEVLNRIQNEKNYIYQQEIERERSKREEQERIASIMNANKVNVNAFIEAGKAAIESNQEAAAELTDEEARRAQEIIDRLNREAEEDEAKKQAEIEEAKRQAAQK